MSITFNLDTEDIIFLKFNDILLNENTNKYNFKRLPSGFNDYIYYTPITSTLLTNSTNIDSYGKEFNKLNLLEDNSPTQEMAYILNNVVSGELTADQQNTIRYLLTTSRPIDLAHPFAYIDLSSYANVTLETEKGKNINGIIAENLNIKGQGGGSGLIGINRLQCNYFGVSDCRLDQVQNFEQNIKSEYYESIINCNFFNGSKVTIGATTINCGVIGFLRSEGIQSGIYNGNLYLDESVNHGMINGDAYFTGPGSINFGTVTGKAYFNNGATNSGQVGYILK
jgi:hypothetical protein